VAKARRILGTRSVGHSGTLDPLASGLMVLLVGEATKLSQYILEQNKAYVVRAKLGVRTDSFDITGKVLDSQTVDLSQEAVREAVFGLQGPLQLKVPIFSATKVGGKKLYEFARSEEPVELPTKVMNFFDLEIRDQGPDWVDVFMRCSKGSFVRAWVNLLGEKLGVGATVEALRRTESMPYQLEQAVTLENFSASQAQGFVPMSAILPDCPLIRVKGQDEVMIGNGLISHRLKTQLISAYRPEASNVIKIVSQEGLLLALIGLEPEKGFAIRRVFRY
jgi:tRNA pseudouridine55 synthase